MALPHKQVVAVHHIPGVGAGHACVVETVAARCGSVKGQYPGRPDGQHIRLGFLGQILRHQFQQRAFVHLGEVQQVFPVDQILGRGAQQHIPLEQAAAVHMVVHVHHQQRHRQHKQHHPA